MTNFAVVERRHLAALLRRVGPDAPTLCEGWVTRDLAVHLIERDSRPDLIAGTVLPKIPVLGVRPRQRRRDDAVEPAVAAAAVIDEPSAANPEPPASDTDIVDPAPVEEGVVEESAVAEEAQFVAAEEPAAQDIDDKATDVGPVVSPDEAPVVNDDSELDLDDLDEM